MVMFILHYVSVCITEEFDKDLKCIRNDIYILKKNKPSVKATNVWRSKVQGK